MRPITPIIPGRQLPVTEFAKNQTEYQTLPAFYYQDDGTVLTRWKLSIKERLLALIFGDVYLWVRTFGQPLQPLAMQIERPKCTERVEQLHETDRACSEG